MDSDNEFNTAAAVAEELAHSGWTTGIGTRVLL